MIQIAIARELYQVGDRVTATVSWNPMEGNVPRALVVRGGWRTEGRGSVATGVIWENRYTPSPTPMQIPVDFVVPAEGPISYNGRLIRIIWEVAVTLDYPMRTDERRFQTFYVEPRRLTL